MVWVRGAYLWSDCGYSAGYRLQVSSGRKAYRLLAPDGRILHRGCEGAVRQAFISLDVQRRSQPPKDTIIVLLHGLALGAWAMGALHRHLQRRWPDAEVVSHQYATTTAPVQVHARDLIQFLEFTNSAKVVHLVAHSLGNIILRHAFHLAERKQWTLPRLGRHIMLGPPNHGATNARKLDWLTPLRVINGPVFRQLGTEWNQLEPELAIPPCEFGIVAGDVGAFSRLSFLLPSRNDFIVTVDETRLAGASDFMRVSRPHLQMLFSRKVLNACCTFLESGSFSTTDSIRRVGTTNLA